MYSTLEFSGFEVDHPHILYHILQGSDEFEMCRILLEIVLSIFFILKLAYEPVRETALK